MDVGIIFIRVGDYSRAVAVGEEEERSSSLSLSSCVVMR